MSESETAQGRPKQVVMDPTQLQKMTESLSADVRALTEKLENKDREYDNLKRLREEQDLKYRELEETVNRVREEKKAGFSQEMDKVVNPFLDKMRQDAGSDPRFKESIDMFAVDLQKGLEDGFMNPKSMANFQTIRAAASANQMTSSKLEEFFRAEKELREQLEMLRKEKESLVNTQNESQKRTEEEQAMKDKMLEDLKKELETLKGIHSKNMSAVENHFDSNTADDSTQQHGTNQSVNAPVPITPETMSVAATASNNQVPKYCSGFETLFDFKPTADWRSFRSDRF